MKPSVFKPTDIDHWESKVALVTGASSGIGAETAKAFIKKGLQVVGVDEQIDKIEKIEKIATELKNEKGKLHAQKCDVTKEEEILRVFEWIKENLGGVDVLVNNAGVTYYASITGGETEGFRHVLDVNVLAYAICTREAVKSMKSRNIDGHIFNVNSTLGHSIPVAGDKYSLYPSSKFAVTAMTEVTRKELILAKTKIKVTSISPGLVKTGIMATAIDEAFAAEFYEGKPTLNPQDVANAIIYALCTPPHVQVCELIIRPVGEMIV